MTENKKTKRALLCAGGTGGHLFPAHALACELTRRGYDIHLVSDHRIERFAKEFPASERHRVVSASPSGKNIFKLFRSLYALSKGYLVARRLMNKIKPDIVIGFGGYPTVPPLLAASSKGVPTIIHEANAVLGRANWLLAKKVDIVALGLPLLKGSSAKSIVTGNPVRDAVLEASKKPYKTSRGQDDFYLTVFGGSQGASFFSSVVLKAIGFLPDELRARLVVAQQARADDEQAVRSAYDVMDIRAEVKVFFDAMPEKIANSHLVICRSGASTTAELAVIGRPAILVPYPFALDHDQEANAALLVQNGGGWVKQQSEMTPEWLAEELKRLMLDADLLERAAQNAHQQGVKDATIRLANAVQALVNDEKINQPTLGGAQES